MSSEKIKLLNALLQEIEKAIPFKDKINSKISKSDIGWQLDHSLKVINNVYVILEKKHSKKYKKDFNLLRSILFPLGYIPRGKGKAPKYVDSKEVISTQDLHTQLDNAKAHIKNTKTLNKDAYFIHQVFGTLSKKKTLRFLEIHTKHHLKIVKDILNT